MNYLKYSLILGVNNPLGPENTGSSPTSPSELIENEELKRKNEEVFNKIISNEENLIVKDRLKEILDYCNKNGLELVDNEGLRLADYKSKNANGTITVDHAIMTIFDPDSGQHYNFFRKSLIGENAFSAGELNFALDKTRLNFGKIQRKINPNVLSNVNSINFIGAQTLGRFSPLTPNTINLTTYTFLRQYQWHTDLDKAITATIVHESIHNWEYNTYGRCGALPQFTRIVPTKYVRGDYNHDEFGNSIPQPAESITTLCEQIYTHSLRTDAIIDGKKAREAYYDKYGEYGSTEQVYQYYMEYYAPQVHRAKRIMRIKND